jgi:hypothetical protein
VVWIDQDATASFHILSASLVILQFDAMLTFAVVTQQENQELTIIRVVVVRNKERGNYAMMGFAFRMYATVIKLFVTSLALVFACFRRKSVVAKPITFYRYILYFLM